MAKLEKVIAKGPPCGRALVLRSQTDKLIYVGSDVHKRAVAVLGSGLPVPGLGWLVLGFQSGLLPTTRNQQPQPATTQAQLPT